MLAEDNDIVVAWERLDVVLIGRAPAAEGENGPDILIFQEVGQEVVRDLFQDQNIGFSRVRENVLDNQGVSLL